MTETQQRRAAALQIATLFIGPLPQGSDFESESSYENYLSLASKIEKYISHGGTILAPTQPGTTMIGGYEV